MIKRSKFTRIKAIKLKKNSLIKIEGVAEGSAVFAISVKKVKKTYYALVMKQDKEGRRYENKELVKETEIIATVYNYQYENDFENIIFNKNQVLCVKKLAKKELSDYAKLKEEIKSGKIKIDELPTKYNLSPEGLDSICVKEV